MACKFPSTLRVVHLQVVPESEIPSSLILTSLPLGIFRALILHKCKRALEIKASWQSVQCNFSSVILSYSSLTTSHLFSGVFFMCLWANGYLKKLDSKTF